MLLAGLLVCTMLAPPSSRGGELRASLSFSPSTLTLPLPLPVSLHLHSFLACFGIRIL